ncbi:endo alpha-1,4 polygalactosaminidase [Kitasatospora sp. MBT63]|uniref:endo alpha-1,4 polygalactosaminidase n=1 Tax=Kitasatospora sp. MBT63 TaxID=1444768 RepID=UPI000AD82FE0|nr:endo alpha-1,4 polygalactosaminidase [Kitasatospora sp. MBT63]
MGVVAACGAGFAFSDASAGQRPGRPTPRPAHAGHRPSSAATVPTASTQAAPAPATPAVPSASPSVAAGATPTGTGKVVLPTPDTGFDYQIGGPYQPPAGVGAVSRDHTAPPVPGLYNVCYLNAFQAQPDATAWWQANHPALLLRDGQGSPVMDEDWGEALLDVSTAARRTELAGVVGGWIDECAAKGYQAVEPDNLDSYERSGGRLDKSHNAAFAQLLAARAHADGLAIGQKNTTDLIDRGRSIGFDFAVSEECGHYDECGAFASAYGNRVFVIEYNAADFAKTCKAFGSTLSVVQRDRDVRPAGRSGYVFKSC